MASPTETEQQLLHLSKTFDEALQTRSGAKLADILAQDAVVHKEDIVLGSDILGRDAVVQYFQAYWERYTYEHEVIAGAADEGARIVFSFSVDRDVTPKREAIPGLPDEAYLPRTTCAIYKHKMDADGNIKEIWFMRDLSNDEIHRKLSNPPNALTFDPSVYKTSSVKESAGNREAYRRAMVTYGKFYDTGDVSYADLAVDESYRGLSVIMAQETCGRDAFKQMVQFMSENYWVPRGSTLDLATTAGDKGFGHWTITGLDKASGKEETMFGMGMMVFNEKQQIREVVEFGQLLPSMRSMFLKEE